MQFSAFLLAMAGSTLVAATPIWPFNSPDQMLGPVTCASGEDFELDESAAAAGAVGFANWIAAGADGLVAPNGNFKGRLGKSYDGITFFACDYKSGGAGSFITGNLVQQVLGDGAYIDTSCTKGQAGFERSNDLAIGRTFEGDKFC